VIRGRTLDVPSLYDPNGLYRYTGGWSLAAIASFLLAVLPNLPGFLAQVGCLDAAHVPAFLLDLYGFAWFGGFAIAFVAYVLLRKLAPKG